MTFPAIINPYVEILGLNGSGLNNGHLYIGVAGADPQTSPQAVYYDAEGTIPASQPLDIQGGYVWRSGAPTRVYTASPYSMRVRDRLDVQVWYNPSVTSAPTVYIFNVKDFGAKGDGITDDTAAIQATVTAAGQGGTVYAPSGNYLLTATINLLTNQTIQGAGVNSTVFQRYNDYGHTLAWGTAGAATLAGIFFIQGTMPAEGATALSNKISGNWAHVYIASGQGLVIHDCWMWRMPYGVAVQNGAGIYIRRCNMQGIWDKNYAAMQEGIASLGLGLSGYVQLVVVENCYFAGSGSALRNVTWTSTDTGAHVFNIHENIGPQYAIQVGGFEGMTIHSNYMGGTSSNSILLGLSASTSSAAQLRITDNYFDGAGTAGAIILFLTTKNGTYSAGVVVSGNHFNGEQLAYQAISAINASGAGNEAALVDFVISNNTCVAIVGAVVTLYNARGGIVCNNSWTGYNSRAVTAGGDVQFCAGVWTSTNTTAVYSHGNLFGGQINSDLPGGANVMLGVVNSGTACYEAASVWNGIGTSFVQIGRVDKVIGVGGTANYQLIGHENIVLMSNNANRQVFPPANPATGYAVTIKDTAGNASTFSTSFIATVDGAANLVMSTNFFSKTLMFNGTSWNVIGN